MIKRFSIPFFSRQLAVLLTGCFFICGCENDLKAVQELGKKKTGVDEVVNMETLYSMGGKMKAKLTAPLVLMYQSDSVKMEFPKSLHVDFYNDQLVVESQLFAKYGRYLENQQKVLLRDSVITFNITGDTLWTSELWWDRNRQLFYTDKRVVIHQPDGQWWEGRKGMLADQNLGNRTLYDASGVKNVADSLLPK
jgi:LPS export ABC transporter protein LptC